MSNKRMLQDIVNHTRIEVDQFLKLAMLLTQMVMKYHKRNETIGVITPGNIEIETEMDGAMHAALISTEHWAVAYRAPEYSGRVNRSLDQRSDLYALGVVFYELLTGTWPYRASSEEEDWLITLMTESPIPLADMRPELDVSIQEIVLKLLAKSPDNRYQTAWGLLADLRNMTDKLAHVAGDEQRNVEIGQWDAISQFRFPDTFIGQTQAKSQLEAGYERIMNEHTAVMFTVYGEAGSGKTSLVEHFLAPRAQAENVMLRAVCQQSEADVRYGVILQLLRTGMDQLWGEAGAEIARLKRALALENGEISRLLWQWMPDSAALLELTPPSDDSLLVDSVAIAQSLLGIMCCFLDVRRPLILFIDDAEWMDEGTLDVLHLLAQTQSVSAMMVIVACRTAPADFGDKWGAYQENSTCIELPPLYYEDVRTWTVAMIHEDATRTRVFAHSIYDRSQGNPARIRALMQSWHQENKLYFDEEQYRWVWDADLAQLEEETQAEGLSLDEQAYYRLSDDAQHLLQVAAVIGHTCQASLLAQVCGYSHAATLSLLDQAEREGLIYRDDRTLGHEDDRLYVFMHKRIWNKLLQLHTQDSRVQWHYKIGLQLKEQLHEEEGQAVIQTVDHLNPCIDQMTEQEQTELAQLNYRAGVTCFKQRKFAASNHYTEVGIGLLERMNASLALTYPFYMHLSYSEYMNGNLEQMRAHMAYLMSRQRELSREKRTRITLYQLEMFAIHNNAEAVEFGKASLTEYGWGLPAHVSMGTVLRETMMTQRALQKQFRIDELPVNHDLVYKSLCKLVVSMALPLLFSDAGKAIVLFSRFIRYGLQTGINDFFLNLVAIYVFILQRGAPFIHKYLPSGAIERLEASSIANEVTEYRLPYMIGMYNQLLKPNKTMDYLFKSAVRAVAANDVTVVNLSLITMLLAQQGTLAERLNLIAYIEEEAKTFIDDKTRSVLQVARLYCDGMQDESIQHAFASFTSNEDQADSYLCLCKADVAYFAEQYEAAWMWAGRGRAVEEAADWMTNRRLRFFQAMAGARWYPHAASEQQKEIAHTLQHLLRKMKRWEGNWGRSSTVHLLLQAEWKIIKGNHRKAMHSYEAARLKSIEEGDVRLEALVLERMYACYAQTGTYSEYAILLMDACTKYAEWGMSAKVSGMKRKYPELRWYHGQDRAQWAASKEGGNATQDQTQALEALPPATQWRLSESESENNWLAQSVEWSTKTVAQRLEAFVKTAVRQSGADRGYVIIGKGEHLAVHAACRPVTTQDDPVSYAVSICRYVKLTGKPILLDQAGRSRFARDQHIQLHRPASVICVSMGEVLAGESWLLYLENTQLSGVFTERDLHVLELLITRLNYLYWMEQRVQVQTLNSQHSVSQRLNDFGEQAPRSEENEPMIEPLTAREQEVLVALAIGYSNKEIAVQFGISEATVKRHVSNIYGKLQVKRRGQAIARAKALHLIE